MFIEKECTGISFQAAAGCVTASATRLKDHGLTCMPPLLRWCPQVSSVALDPNTRKWRLNGSSTRKPPPGAQPQAQVLGEYDALVMADVLCGRQGA